jgi:probable rRNA maturation factor
MPIEVTIAEELGDVTAFDKEEVSLLVEKKLIDAGRDPQLLVSFAVVTDEAMRQLNRTHHDIDRSTDVLSFPYLDDQSQNSEHDFFLEENPILGDIALAYPTVVKQAEEKGKTIAEEILFLIDHGMDHLLGKHHD